MGKNTKPAEAPAAVTDNHRYLTKQEVADFLQISATSVYMLTIRKANPLPSIKLGKSRRYPNDKLKTWAAALRA